MLKEIAKVNCTHHFKLLIDFSLMKSEFRVCIVTQPADTTILNSPAKKNSYDNTYVEMNESEKLRLKKKLTN